MSARRPRGAAVAQREARSLEERLRRSEADFARAQRQASIGTWRWSIPRDELLECSDEYARIHGVTPDEIMEHQKRRVIHPDDVERVEQVFREVDADRSAYSVEYRIIRPDGEVRHILEIGEATAGSSEYPDEQVGTLQDITELKRAQHALERAHEELEARVAARTAELQEREMLLRTAARISRMGYAIWDEETQTYASLSEEYAQVFGCSVEEYLERFGTIEKDLIGIHPDDQERYSAFDEAYRASPHEAEIEYRVALPGKPIQYLRDVLQPVYDDSGRLAQTILAVQDITELKRTEEQLRQAQKMEAVGHLTGGIAHDFNNLLAVILGNLELIEASIDEKGEAPEWIHGAIAAAERGARLTQRLLAFSRKQALRPELVDAGELVQGMLDLLRRTLGKSIEVELVRGDDLWASRVDPNQLENSILNLAINARDAMARGGTLEIETANAHIDEDYAVAHSDVESGQYVVVTVRDSGAGMSPEILEHAFEPFFTTKDVGQGSGLGLSMVYGFVKQSGGHIRISSDEGGGTAVEVYLPRHLGGDECSARGEARGLPRARGEAVLVVDDNAELRALVARLLTSLGYEVREADSGARALQLLESAGRTDLLITDVVLPGGLSGRELAGEAERRVPELPVLYISGYTEHAMLREGGVDVEVQFLQKPFRRAEIARAIRRVLESKKT